MFKERYCAAQKNVTPSSALVCRTSERLKESGKTPVPARRKWRGAPALAAACATVCLLGAFPVLAANAPAVHDALYAVSPATAQFFMPVRESCEANGICMEVTASYIHGDTAEIYVALRDLEGGRVDETTDLFDSYSIDRPFDASATCRFVDFDPATETATFLIRITGWGDRKIEGSKITFSVREFISGKRTAEELALGVDLTRAARDSEMQTVDLSGYSARSNQKIPDSATVLVPGPPLCEPAENAALTGLGYVDGKLNVQLAFSDTLHTDSHGWVTLTDPQGNTVESMEVYGFNEILSDGTRTSYSEFVFDVSSDALEGYTLTGSFYTATRFTEGPWQVTFPLESN